MKLTIEQVLERWQEYTSYTQNIKDLKDLLLDLKTVYAPEDLDLNEKKLNKVISEIKYIQKECMLPIIKDILAHVEAYRGAIEGILIKEKDESVVEEMNDFLTSLKREIITTELSVFSVSDVKMESTDIKNC
jgi:hypothetical protein